MSDDRKNRDYPEPDWLEELLREKGIEEPAPKHAAPEPRAVRPQPTGDSRGSEANIRYIRPDAADDGYYGEPVMRRGAGAHGEREPYAVRAEQAYESTRRGRRGGSNALLITLIVVLVLGMGFAAWQLGSIFRSYQRDRSAYEELANRAIVDLAEQDEETQSETETVPAAVPEGGAAHITSEVPITVDWAYLRSINSSIVGWLYCPDTIINYPVVQTSDQEFYLKHGFDGNPNNAGALFADPGSVAGVTQSNFIIYGHNMKDESMFGTFKSYVDKSYYDAHPTMYYLTPTGSYRIDLLCAHVTESFVVNLPGYFSTIGDYQAYINDITSDAFWVDYDAVTTDLQLMSLSTCTTAAGIEDARFIVYGVMVPIQ